jgi:hypothetical protein
VASQYEGKLPGLRVSPQAGPEPREELMACRSGKNISTVKTITAIPMIIQMIVFFMDIPSFMSACPYKIQPFLIVFFTIQVGAHENGASPVCSGPKRGAHYGVRWLRW